MRIERLRVHMRARRTEKAQHAPMASIGATPDGTGAQGPGSVVARSLHDFVEINVEGDTEYVDDGDWEQGVQLVGDVEFHLHASEWYAHGHHNDPRYNQVILHVVLYPGGHAPTRRQDGQIIPICVPQAPCQTSGWPCQQQPFSESEMTTTLLYAGLQRFAEESERYMRRLHTLTAWMTRWREVGVWHTLSQELCQPGRDVKGTASALRAALHPLSRARADILIVNIVLPFAAAIADLENDPHLAARAQQIFLAYPGPVSNRITRGMKTQLQLSTEPAQACLQQGLQHIHAHTCRAKACQDCLCGGQRL